LNREIEKLCSEINQLRISNAAVCTAIGELSVRVENLAGSLAATNSFLKDQTDIQRRIFETKSHQKEVYDELLELMRAIKQKQDLPLIRKFV